MRCLILDDEALARKEMRVLLAAHPWLAVVGEAEEADEALALYQQHLPEVVFVDVELQGESGFDFLARMEPPAPWVILVTAHDNYAVRGFEHHVFDYLLKPVCPERLAEALSRIDLQAPGDHSPVVVFKTGSVYRQVEWSRITHIVAEGNYTRLLLRDEASVLVLKPLKEWIAEMPRADFCQIHRTALVALSAIQEVRIVRRGRRELELTDGSTFPIGPSHWLHLKECFTTET